MPSPLYLQVMGVSLSEYNSYSSAKKSRFQLAAAKKIAELHETDLDAYIKVTKDAVSAQELTAREDEEAEFQDKERS